MSSSGVGFMAHLENGARGTMVQIAENIVIAGELCSGRSENSWARMLRRMRIMLRRP